MKDYYKDEQNILEDKVEYHRQNIRDEEDELVDEQSIIPLRCKLLDLCSTKELTQENLKRYEAQSTLCLCSVIFTIAVVHVSYVISVCCYSVDVRVDDDLQYCIHRYYCYDSHPTKEWFDVMDYPK